MQRLGDPPPIQRLRRKLLADARGEVLEIGVGPGVNFLPGEQIPLADESVDTVVSTFTLCTIPRVEEVIRGVKSVLRPGGRLIFFEICASPEARVRRWQGRWEPIHRRLFEGLYLTRDIPGLLEGAGFNTSTVERGCMARFPKSWSHCCWGIAVAALPVS